MKWTKYHIYVVGDNLFFCNATAIVLHLDVNYRFYYHPKLHDIYKLPSLLWYFCQTDRKSGAYSFHKDFNIFQYPQFHKSIFSNVQFNLASHTAASDSVGVEQQHMYLLSENPAAAQVWVSECLGASV